MELLLKVVDIHKHYQGKPLLRGVNFEVRAGEIVSLLGPSGSGKSTLLRIIAGLETAERGKVLWQGQPMDAVQVHQRNFSLMFQDYALFPHMNVFANVAFGLRMRGLTDEIIRKRVMEALDMVDMLAFKDRRVTDLSGGEQQRVALARALAPQPRLLMLDEPLGALDRSLKEQLCNEVRALLHKLGIPAIYVTHDQQEAFTISERLVILHDGRVQQQGTAEEILTQPASLWLANFLGFTNQLRGQILTTSPLKIQTSQGIFISSITDQKLKPSQPVTLVLKPGGVKVVNVKENENMITGQIEDVIFRGDGYMIKLSLKEEKTISFTTQREYKIGSLINVKFPPESVLGYA